MILRFEYCEVTDLANSPFWSKSPLKEDNVEQRLLFGLYWALCLFNFAGMCIPQLFYWCTQREAPSTTYNYIPCTFGAFWVTTVEYHAPIGKSLHLGGRHVPQFSTRTYFYGPPHTATSRRDQFHWQSLNSIQCWLRRSIKSTTGR